MRAYKTVSNYLHFVESFCYALPCLHLLSSNFNSAEQATTSYQSGVGVEGGGPSTFRNFAENNPVERLKGRIKHVAMKPRKGIHDHMLSMHGLCSAKHCVFYIVQGQANQPIYIEIIPAVKLHFLLGSMELPPEQKVKPVCPD